MPQSSNSSRRSRCGKARNCHGDPRCIGSLSLCGVLASNCTPSRGVRSWRSDCVDRSCHTCSSSRIPDPCAVAVHSIGGRGSCWGDISESQQRKVGQPTKALQSLNQRGKKMNLIKAGVAGVYLVYLLLWEALVDKLHPAHN